MASNVLEDATDAGIWNILALRGDPPCGATEWQETEGGFKNAGELVKFIRSKYGNDFSIGVAGHPQGHPMSEAKHNDLRFLKEKVDAGADYIVTQVWSLYLFSLI